MLDDGVYVIIFCSDMCFDEFIALYCYELVDIVVYVIQGLVVTVDFFFGHFATYMLTWSFYEIVYFS